MQDQKPWWQSKTQLGAVAQMVTGIAVAFGLIDIDQATELTTSGPELVVGVTTSLHAVWMFISRWVAKSQIAPRAL